MWVGQLDHADFFQRGFFQDINMFFVLWESATNFEI